MSDLPDLGWQMEKAGNILKATCFMLEHTVSIAHNLTGDPDYNLRDTFQEIIWDASKLYCDSARAVGGMGVGKTWSPELAHYLFDHPDKCEETLKIIADPDYHDTYYWQKPDQGGS